MKTKRMAKKLSFSKETVSHLDNDNMNEALGGIVIYYTTYCTNKTNCNCNTDYNCPSLPNQCTDQPKMSCRW